MAKEWSKQGIIRAIQEWYSLYGEVPYTSDWKNPNRPDGFPSHPTVEDYFDSFGDAVEAAGFSRRPRGMAGHVGYEGR